MSPAEIQKLLTALQRARRQLQKEGLMEDAIWSIAEALEPLLAGIEFLVQERLAHIYAIQAR